MSAMSELQASVAAKDNVAESAKALVHGLSAQIEAAATERDSTAALAAFKSDLDEHADALAAAVTENTASPTSDARPVGLAPMGIIHASPFPVPAEAPAPDASKPPVQVPATALSVASAPAPSTGPAPTVPPSEPLPVPVPRQAAAPLTEPAFAPAPPKPTEPS